MKTAAISVRDLNFSFNQLDDNALKNINLDIAQGSRCLLVGANGGGFRLYLSIYLKRKSWEEYLVKDISW